MYFFINKFIQKFISLLSVVLLFFFLVPSLFYFELYCSKSSYFQFFIFSEFLDIFDFEFFSKKGLAHAVCFNLFSEFIFLNFSVFVLYVTFLIVFEHFYITSASYKSYFSFFLATLVSFYLSFEFFTVLQYNFLFQSWLKSLQIFYDFRNSYIFSEEHFRMFFNVMFEGVRHRRIPLSIFFDNVLFSLRKVTLVLDNQHPKHFVSSFYPSFLNFFELSWNNVAFGYLCALFFPIVFLVGFNFHTVKNNYFYSLVLLTLNIFCFAIFLTNNFFLFYVFFELLTIPIAVLIIKWGSTFELKSLDAGYRFFLYAFLTSLPLLFGLVILYFEGFYNISLIKDSQIFLPEKIQFLLFPFLAIPFLAKIPLFPLHTWLPFAHAEASTVGSVLLAAILLKISFFGLIKFVIPLCFLVVDVYKPYLQVLGLLSCFYTSFSSLVQIDLKRVVAYSSISHMSVAFLAFLNLTVFSFETVILYSIAHAISASALFFIVGILYARTGQRNLHLYSDLFTVIPKYSLFFIFFILVNVSFPFTSGFVVEFLSFLHTMQYDYISTFFIMLSTFFITSVSYWTMVRLIFFHSKTFATDSFLKKIFFKNESVQLPCENNFLKVSCYNSFRLYDLTYYEELLLSIFFFLSLYFAFFPTSVFDLIHSYV